MFLFLLRIISAGLVLFIGVSCVPKTVPYNPFKITQDKFYEGVKTIVLTPLNIPEGMGEQVSLNAQFESYVETKLKKARFEVVSSKVYKEIWDRRVKQIGGYYNPRTGEVDKSKYEAIVEYTRNELKSGYNADALLYSAICIVQIRFYGNMATWHGTSEMVKMPGYRSQTDRGSIRALSFCVCIEDIHGVKSYVNSGGIQLLSKLKAPDSVFKNEEFVNVPEREILNNLERNEAAVKIALGPLIDKQSPSQTPK